MTNPPLWPLLQSDASDDILLLPLNPFAREETPRTAGDIVDRLNEVVFNAPLVAELRNIAFVQDLIEQGRLRPGARGRDRRTLIHAIEADDHLGDLPMSSKFNTEWGFLTDLKARGRSAAEAWLKTCLPKVGKASSIDLKARFL